MSNAPASITSTVIVGVAAAAVVAVGSCVIAYASLMSSVEGYGRQVLAPTIVNWPMRGAGGPESSISFLLGVLLFMLAVGVTTWLGARSARTDRGGWAVALSAWLGAAIGAALAGTATGLIMPASYSDWVSIIYGMTLGPYAGLYWGWPIAVATAIAFRLANRDSAGTGTDGPNPPDPTTGISPFGT